MKICAVIAEYNPFHLGHLKHIDYVKNVLGAEKVIVIMSGNFTQRGEPAILDKFSRARHAVLAGADAVIELPTVFATANAECFARGAVNLICDLGVVDGLCFGVESGSAEEYYSLARALNNESKEFKKALKAHLDKGVSLAKAKFLAVSELSSDGFNQDLVSSPNNILGLEYTKALLKNQSGIAIYPMLREGDHNDRELKKGITSATSIREKIKAGEVKKTKGNLPPFVYKDLKGYPFAFDKIIMAALARSSEDDLRKIIDCTEGLENRIKALSKDNLSVDALVEKVSTKRYPQTRIRRILTSNLLGIKEKFLFDCLDSKLYAKILALDSNKKDIISLLKERSEVPLLTRKSDASALKKFQEKCFEIDVLAQDLYSLATDTKINENNMLII
ncbi:MAG: nucleotidyltransferase family protein [Clostridia bacterium]|nr:nucleotidyltransferase family protein [Clostridia bacterium]